MSSWIWSESITSPSLAISSALASRVDCASSLRLAIRSSTDIEPMIERRWPWKTSRTRSCIWPCWASRKRTPALVIEASSSPTLKIATPRTPTGIFWTSTPSTSSSALSADIPRYWAFCITGMTNAPPPVTILKIRSPTARPLTPKPVTISASSAAGTFHSVLNVTASSSGTAMMSTTTTISVVFTSGLLVEGGDEHGPRGHVLDDDDLGVGPDLAAVDVAGEKGLDAAADRHHDFARASRRDPSGGGHPAVGAHWRLVHGQRSASVREQNPKMTRRSP